MSHTDKAPEALAGDAGQVQQEPIESSRTDIGKTSPRADVEAALSALTKLLGDRPRVLTAIASNDDKRTFTRTFVANDDDGQRRFIERHNSAERCCNIYFHVNPTIGSLNKKAAREDIESLAFLHVDIDPRVGEDIKEEQERALKLLQDPPGDLPPPTCIIFSGGGCQSFWHLKNPVLIDGDPDRYEDAKRYNVQLEILFGADKCHNVDRIMRVPGTVNWPDKTKREKGRVPTLAVLVEHHADRVYPIERFKKAPVESTSTAGAGHKARVKIESGKIERLSGADDPHLDGVSDDCKVVIVQGHDPEDSTRFAKNGGTELDRSKALFYVVNEMVRVGCDDDTIYAVITDPDFKISASVLDKGSMAQKYAVRQIERAHQKTKPKIQLPGGDRQHRDTAIDLAPLMRQGNWYRRGSTAFALSPAGQLDVVRSARAVTDFEREADFYKIKTDTNGNTSREPTPLTERLARVFLDCADFVAVLPEIRAVTDCPVLIERDGKLLHIVGYDEQTGILARGESPQEMDWETGRDILLGLLCDYLFTDSGDRARFIAALLTPALHTSGMLGDGRVDPHPILGPAGMRFFLLHPARCTWPDEANSLGARLPNALWGRTSL